MAGLEGVLTPFSQSLIEASVSLMGGRCEAPCRTNTEYGGDPAALYKVRNASANACAWFPSWPATPTTPFTREIRTGR